MKPFSSAVSRIASLVDRWHWVLLIVAAPFLLFPSPRNSPAFLLLPVIWIAGLLAKREPVPRTPLNLALLLLFVMLLVSEWATFDLMFSLPKITGMILGIAVFFAIVRAGQTTLGWWLSLLAFLGVGVSISVFGLIGTSWGAKISALDSFTEHLVLRIKGIPGIEEGLNPNQLAGALIWVLPVLVVLSGFVLVNHQHLLEVYGRRVRTTLVVAVLSSAILVLFTFVLTESRSAYIGFLLSMYAAISVSSSRRWRWLLLLVPLIGLIVVLMWQGSLSAIGERLVDGEVLDSPAFALNSLPGRFELWSRAIYGIQDFPFTGMGMNTFRKVVHVLYPLFNADPSTDIGHAHNEYLQAALDLGIPGLVAFLSVQMVTFAMILQTWLVAGRRTVVALAVQSGSSLIGEGALPRSLALGLGSGLLAHMIFGLTDATALGAKPGILFWMSLGLVTSLFLRVNSGAFLGYPILRDWRRS